MHADIVRGATTHIPGLCVRCFLQIGDCPCVSSVRLLDLTFDTDTVFVERTLLDRLGRAGLLAVTPSDCPIIARLQDGD